AAHNARRTRTTCRPIASRPPGCGDQEKIPPCSCIRPRVGEILLTSSFGYPVRVRGLDPLPAQRVPFAHLLQERGGHAEADGTCDCDGENRYPHGTPPIWRSNMRERWKSYLVPQGVIVFGA